MKKHIKRISLIIVCIILLLVGSFCIYYFSIRLSSVSCLHNILRLHNLCQIILIIHFANASSHAAII